MGRSLSIGGKHAATPSCDWERSWHKSGTLRKRTIDACGKGGGREEGGHGRRTAGTWYGMERVKRYFPGDFGLE